ncbi:hypothetical protein LOTGIDRAFT_160396 [Lottia gigantea]|uniref:SCP domain-containing protein n=1 Tax=Lottia gigantea TaxID=225164 RepID=V4AEG5_LOTGI|nr:hypothetical protein LOTGIDRAFT_160396 [Lottia gigantea]ESO95277.1 hypothetical protein LOTGIDRAFT_160396 [Lottia gigantea]
MAKNMVLGQARSDAYGICEKLNSLGFVFDWVLISCSDLHQRFRNLETTPIFCIEDIEFGDINLCLGVTEADKTTIVTLHNQFRAEVKPTASNMLKMKWNNEIAKVAQKWAENCDFVHDSGSARAIPARYGVGQNLAWGSRSFEAAINLWQDEKEDFTYGADGNDFKKTGHYTQINWAMSNLVGCGYAKCGTTNYYVCNYAPAGNIGSRFKTPYKQGEPCADCPDNCDSTGKLCVCENTCWHGSNMSVSDCKCDCITESYVTDSCKIDCNVEDSKTWCGDNGVSCTKFAKYCPNKCKLCPAADYRNVEKEKAKCDGIKTAPVVLLILLLATLLNIC